MDATKDRKGSQEIADNDAEPGADHADSVVSPKSEPDGTLEDLEGDVAGLMDGEEEDGEEEGDEEEEEDDDEGDDDEYNLHEEEEAMEEEPEPDFTEDYFTEYREKFPADEDFKTLDSSNVQDLINMLAKVKLVWPEDLPYYDEQEYDRDPSRAHFPPTFYHCSPKEKAVMWHAENFRRQFSYIYPDRRPLLIAPRNECGTQKLFPTFINPTVIGYPDFCDPESTGKFMKDFLSPQFFRPPTRVPRMIRSHVTVLKKRKANSFEFSVIIVSLMNGAGFDTYVVDGYATKEITTMCEQADYVDIEDEATRKITEAEFDVSKEELEKKEPDHKGADEDDAGDDDFDLFGKKDEVRPVSPSKYRVKAPKIHFSRYEHAMQKRADDKAEEERLIAEKEAYDEMIRNLRPPTPDPLFGFRTHAWVMVMKGKRGIPESFFIEPFSGLRKEISDQNFLGIEAIFNEKNYYANIQDCSAGISDISYDLNDTAKWSKLLLEPPCRRNCVSKKPEDEEDDDEEEGAVTSYFGNEDDEDDTPVCQKFLDMPISWTTDLDIPQEDYERKFPDGSKTKDYNDAFVETAAPWVHEDGLIKKVIKFDGTTRDPKRLVYIEEQFAHRQDKLERRKWIKEGRELHEYFEKGRKDCLKEHVHQSGKNKPHYPRHLYYYSDVHPQHVSHRQVIQNGLIEEFEGRDDLLYYRAIFYGGFLCHTIPVQEDPKIFKVKAMLDLMRGEDHGNKAKPRKKILRIDEKYHRNQEVEDPNQDISEKYLLMSEGKINLYFHYGDENFTRKSMEFFKPRGVNVESVDFRPEDCVEFRVDPFSVPTSTYEKFMILQVLAKDELRASSMARQAEDDIYSTVIHRVQEDWRHKMEPDPYKFTDQSQSNREGTGNDDEEDLSGIDFATPYIERFGKPANKRQEIALKKKIIQDARIRIIKKAKSIQEEYEAESAKLQTKMEWYDRMKDSMKAVEDEEFHVFYNEILFRMHIMEQRLIRHREQAPIYFNGLLLEVLRHPLLNVFANRKLSKEGKLRKIQEEQDKEERKQKEAMLAKIPKDICCEYRFKYEPKKDIAGAIEASGALGAGADTSGKADGQKKSTGGKGKSKGTGKRKKSKNKT